MAIGKETAKLLANDGYIVYAAARRIDKMNDLKTVGIHLLEMDVTNDASMVEEVISLIQPVADGWSQIRSQVAAPSYLS